MVASDSTATQNHQYSEDCPIEIDSTTPAAPSPYLPQPVPDNGRSRVFPVASAHDSGEGELANLHFDGNSLGGLSQQNATGMEDKDTEMEEGWTRALAGAQHFRGMLPPRPIRVFASSGVHPLEVPTLEADDEMKGL